jgi:NADPH:quinone reductase-like Zn-dependent oxidoreductase
LNGRDLNYIGKEERLEMGIEGSGRVIKSGGGVTGWSIKNKRVAFLLNQLVH